MANNLLIIPKYSGQELPVATLKNYERVFLVTNKQESLPMNVVATLLSLASQCHLEFMETEFSSDIELLFNLAFKIAQFSAETPGIEISFLTDDKRYEALINAAALNGYSTNTISEGFDSSTTTAGISAMKPQSTISSIPTPKTRPTPAPQPAPQPTPIPKTKPTVAPAPTGGSNQAMLNGLLNK